MDNNTSIEQQHHVFRSTQEELETAQLYHRAGDLGKAEDMYIDLLKKEPSNADAHHLLGLIALQVGKNPAAQELIKAAVELDDSQALYHANLGAAYYAEQQFEPAEKEYQRACELDPEYDEAYLNLGIILKHQGRIEEAVEPLDRAVTLRPTDAKAFSILAECLARLEDHEQAESIARAAANLNPRDKEALVALVNAFALLNMPREAIPFARRLVNQEPSNPKHYQKLSRLCLDAGFTDQGTEHARKAMHLDPENHVAYKLLSRALLSSTEWDDALEVISQGVDRFPDNVDLLTQKAAILERKGHLKEAYEIVRPMIDKQSKYPVQALHVFTSIARQFGAEKQAANMFSAALKNPNIPEDIREGMYFQAGMLYNDVGDYDRAFEAYKQGNEAKPRTYHKEIMENHFQALMDLYTQDFFEYAPKNTMGSKRPIFIVGMPRSGTSLTEQILASHPQVYGAGELSQIGSLTFMIADAFPGQDKKGYPYCMPDVTEDLLNQAAQVYLDHIAELDSDALHVTDKMPQNFLHLGLIAMLFPEASIIHCRRDPRDTCLSCYFQNFVAAGLTFAYDLENLGHYYNLYHQLMEHWEQHLPLPLYASRYEDLVADPEPNIRKLLEFCHLEWSDDCLNFYKNKRETKTASYEQVRRPIYKSSSKRWRRHEQHIQPLLDALDDQTIENS